MQIVVTNPDRRFPLDPPTYARGFFRVEEESYVPTIQEKLDTITDATKKFLEEMDIPEGVESLAYLRLEGYDARMRGSFFGTNKVGTLAFPRFSVETNFGSSSFSIHPQDHLGTPYLGRLGVTSLLLETTGSGIAKKIEENVLPLVEEKFPLDSQRNIGLKNLTKLSPVYGVDKWTYVPVVSFSL